MLFVVAGIFVRVVARNTGQAAAFLEALARHQADRLKANGHGIVQANSLSLWRPVTFRAEIDDFPHRSATQFLHGDLGRYVIHSGTVAPLARYSRMNLGQIVTLCDSRGVASETPPDGFHGLCDSECGIQSLRRISGMAQSSSWPLPGGVERDPVLEECAFTEAHRCNSLRTRAERPVQDRRALASVLLNRYRKSPGSRSIRITKPGPFFDRYTRQQSRKLCLEHRPER